MRIKFLSCFVVFCSILLMAAASPSEIEHLIKAHNEACGGEIALWNLQSIARTGTITFYNQNPKKPVDKYEYQTKLVYPSKLHERLKNDEQILLERGTDGINFWAWDSQQYTYIEDEDKQASILTTAEQANRELLFIKENYKDIQLLKQNPEWAPNESECIQGLKIKNDKEVTFCFDKIYHFMSAIGSDAEYRILDNYRSIGTVYIPFHIMHYKYGLIAYEMQLQEAQQDEAIDDDVFTFPQSEDQLDYEE